jgi:NADH-quinone oxidoreductase subunit M
MLLFLAFTIAFVVKAPVFPFHTWSPDAYAEAPASGSILLAGIMAKLGSYGIVRFDLALFPHAVVVIAPLLMVLGVVGIIYGGIVAAAQKDLKRLVAYSSLAHMGFIVLGAFALTSESVSGAVLQMVNHGIYTAALFLLIAMIYKRSNTFQIAPLKGLQHRAPLLAGTFTVVLMASIGVPGLNGFIGEFLILAGTFITHRWYAVVATIGVVIAAVYMLWGYQQVFHGPEENAPSEAKFPEMTWAERAAIAPLILLIVFMGIWPAPILNRITPTVDSLVNHVVVVGRANVPAPGLPAVTTQALRQGAGK